MPKSSPADTLASLESGSDRLYDTQNGRRNFENDVLEDVNSVPSKNCRAIGASGTSDHIKVDARFEAFHNHPCRYNTEQYASERTLKQSELYPCTTLSSLSRDGASTTSTSFHVKNELTEVHSPTSQWSGGNRREEDTPSSAAETVQGGVHDIAKPTTAAALLKTSEYCAQNEGEKRSCKRSTEEVLNSQVLSPSTRPLEKSSQSTVDCDSAWALGYIDLRNTVTVQATTAMAMPSYNLKNQSQSLPPSKEAAGGVRTVFQCHTCQKEFVTEKYLCMHMALHRPQASANSPSSSSKQGNSKVSMLQSSDESVKLIKSDGSGASHWTCKICSKTFAQSSNYKNHIRTHSDERPFVCNVCSIGFKERYHLKKHILFKHTKELKEECRVCGKRFKDSTAVRAHERIHSEERPYGCQRCNKTFKTSECLWHHENRSRTCGKSLKTDADGVTVNPVPRFRRGRHPGKRTAPSKSKTIAEAEENSVGEVSACLSLDHVEEISASVKIELERDIPEYYFKAVPGLYAYEFENIMDVLMPDGSLTPGQEVTFPSSQLSVNALDVANKHKQPDSDLHKSLPISVSATLGSRHLDHLAAQLWSNEWTSSSAGVFLGSPSRPVSASYDSIVDTYSPGTPEKSWKQDISNFRHGSAVYVGEISNADLVKSPNFNLSHYTQQKQQQQQQQQQTGQQIQLSTAAICATTTSTGGLPFASVMQQINDDAAKPEIHHPGSMQTQHMQHIRRSYADDFGPTDEASRSVLALTSLPASDLWPSKMGEVVPVVGAAPGRSQEISATNAAASYPISIANVPTAVVAPFKRESTNRPTQVNGTEADQPVKNSLPPFETFAPMTLRVQKSQQAISTPIPSLSPIASYATFANPYSSDGSIADQCPTIQKYLLRGHPNVTIKPNRNLPEDLGQREISINRQWHTLSPVRPLTTKDIWKRPNVHSHHFQMEQDHTIVARPLGPEFMSESQLKLSGLISLPGEMDATQSFNFIKMAPASSYSQSAILQPLAEIGDSNARSAVNLHRKM